jgi:Putative excisionase (DUF1233)
MNWVLIKKLYGLSGITENASYAYIKKGKWLEGKHYKKAPNGRIFFNTKEIEKWIEGKAA